MRRVHQPIARGKQRRSYSQRRRSIGGGRPNQIPKPPLHRLIKSALVRRVRRARALDHFRHSHRRALGSQRRSSGAICPKWSGPSRDRKYTPRWSEMDSNVQLRDALAPPTAWPVATPSDSGGEWRFSDCRPTSRSVCREAGNCLDETVAPAVDRSHSDEASKPLPIWRGTGSSNPPPSSGESGANSTP